MQEKSSSTPPHVAGIAESGPYGRILLATAKWLAFVGGLIFTGLVIMSIISIVGRKLFNTPVPGDVEVLQMFAAVASAAFFAYCHLMRGEVKVDFFGLPQVDKSIWFGILALMVVEIGLVPPPSA